MFARDFVSEAKRFGAKAKDIFIPTKKSAPPPSESAPQASESAHKAYKFAFKGFKISKGFMRSKASQATPQASDFVAQATLANVGIWNQAQNTSPPAQPQPQPLPTNETEAHKPSLARRIFSFGHRRVASDSTVLTDPPSQIVDSPAGSRTISPETFVTQPDASMSPEEEHIEVPKTRGAAAVTPAREQDEVSDLGSVSDTRSIFAVSILSDAQPVQSSEDDVFTNMALDPSTQPMLGARAVKSMDDLTRGSITATSVAPVVPVLANMYAIVSRLTELDPDTLDAVAAHVKAIHDNFIVDEEEYLASACEVNDKEEEESFMHQPLADEPHESSKLSQHESTYYRLAGMIEEVNEITKDLETRKEKLDSAKELFEQDDEFVETITSGIKSTDEYLADLMRQQPRLDAFADRLWECTRLPEAIDSLVAALGGSDALGLSGLEDGEHAVAMAEQELDAALTDLLEVGEDLVQLLKTIKALARKKLAKMSETPRAVVEESSVQPDDEVYGDCEPEEEEAWEDSYESPHEMSPPPRPESRCFVSRETMEEEEDMDLPARPGSRRSISREEVEVDQASAPRKRVKFAPLRDDSKERASEFVACVMRIVHWVTVDRIFTTNGPAINATQKEAYEAVKEFFETSDRDFYRFARRISISVMEILRDNVFVKGTLFPLDFKNTVHSLLKEYNAVYYEVDELGQQEPEQTEEESLEEEPVLEYGKRTRIDELPTREMAARVFEYSFYERHARSEKYPHDCLRKFKLKDDLHTIEEDDEDEEAGQSLFETSIDADVSAEMFAGVDEYIVSLQQSVVGESFASPGDQAETSEPRANSTPPTSPMPGRVTILVKESNGLMGSLMGTSTAMLSQDLSNMDPEAESEQEDEVSAEDNTWDHFSDVDSEEISSMYKNPDGTFVWDEPKETAGAGVFNEAGKSSLAGPSVETSAAESLNTGVEDNEAMSEICLDLKRLTESEPNNTI